jgi:Transposase DDE domain
LTIGQESGTFSAMYFRKKSSGRNGTEYEYLQIVRSYREGPKVRQEVIATLGRTDKLLSGGEIDGLLRSLARFSDKLRVVEAARLPDVAARPARQWGPALVFGRLWQQQRIPEILGKLSQDRKFEFDVERACFAMALQRLCAPGSDLQGFGWLSTAEAPGFEALALQHLYRTAGFLAEMREELEQELSWADRDLFSQDFDLVFIDTTSLSVYRDTENDLFKRGYSRKHRPDLPQTVLCVIVNAYGWPVAWEVYPGNTADVVAMEKMINRLRKRLAIRDVVVVADRGMISRDIIKLLTQDNDAPFRYVLGCRMRRQKEVNEEVLSRAGRYRAIRENLEVKEVRIGDRRYVVCRNPLEAKKDKAVREAVLAKLERIIAEQGPKALIGNRGYARFLKVDKGSVSINREAIENAARLDGKFVLTTNTDLTSDEVALTYKSLWRVERTFREQKSTLEVCPIYHHCHHMAIGHIAASFLALRLEVDLQRRLDERKVEVSWPDLMRDLGQVQSIVLDLDGNRYRLRSEMVGSSYQAFQAAGVRPPDTVSLLGPVPSSPERITPIQLSLL